MDKEDALKKIQTLQEVGLSDISIEGLEKASPPAVQQSKPKAKLVYWDAPKSLVEAVIQIVGAVLIGGILISLSQCHSKQAEQKLKQKESAPFTDVTDRSPAYFACKSLIIDKALSPISPSAAKFQGAFAAPYTVIAENRIRFESYVDAPSPFNVPIRTPFSCTAEKRGDQWVATSLDSSFSE